jgi:hypothetical protein
MGLIEEVLQSVDLRTDLAKRLKLAHPEKALELFRAARMDMEFVLMMGRMGRAAERDLVVAGKSLSRAQRERFPPPER